MSSFNKTEYHSQNPEQGVSLLRIVRDDKSHSNTYFKQVDMRNQTLTDTINSLPSKLKNKLSLDVPLQHKKAQSLRLKIDRPKQVLSHINYYTDMEDTLDGEADAFAEMEMNYDYVEDVEDEVSVDEDALRQHVETEDEEEEVCEFDDDYYKDEESSLEDKPDVHLSNLKSLADYYASSASKTPSLNDDEYEFWLLFEIRAYEDGNHTDAIDVKQNMAYYAYNNINKTVYDDDDACAEYDKSVLYSENQALPAQDEDEYDAADKYEYDIDDKRQDEIENRRAEAMEDR